MAQSGVSFGEAGRDQFHDDSRLSCEEWKQRVHPVLSATIVPHDPSKEPNRYHASWANADRAVVTEVLTQFRDIARLPHDMFTHATPQMATLEDFIINCTLPVRYTTPTRISVTGPLNSGKSTLVNSLTFPKERVCPAISGSEPTTRWPMIIKYDNTIMGDNSSLVLRLYLLSPQEIKAECIHLSNEMKAYFAYQDEYDSERSIMEYHEKRIGQAKDLARRFYLAICKQGGKDEQDCADVVEELTDIKNHKEFSNGYVAKITTWATVALAQIRHNMRNHYNDVGNSQFIEIHYKNATAFASGLESFRTGPQEVLIKYAEALTKDELFSSGIQIIDLPGPGRDDPRTDQIAHSFFERSDYNLLCTGTTKVINDPELNDQIRESLQILGTEKTLVLKTRCDEEANDMDLKSFYAHIQWKVAVEGHEALEKVENDIKVLEANTRSVVALVEDDASDTDSLLQLKFVAPEVTELEEYKEYLLGKCKANMVWWKYEELTQALEQKYVDRKTGDDRLQVRFVSAGTYRSWISNRLTVRSRPFLKVEQTGIPRLRRELLGFTSGDSFESHKSHVLGLTTACVDYIDRICSNSDCADASRAISTVKEGIFWTWFSTLQYDLPRSIDAFLENQGNDLVAKLIQTGTLRKLDATAANWIQDSPGQKLHRLMYDKLGREGGYFNGGLEPVEYAWANSLREQILWMTETLRAAVLEQVSSWANDMRAEIQRMVKAIPEKLDGLHILQQNLSQSKDKWTKVAVFLMVAITFFETDAKDRLRESFESLSQRTRMENKESTALSRALRQQLAGFRDEFWNPPGLHDKETIRTDKGVIIDAQQKYVREHVASEKFIRTVCDEYVEAARDALRGGWTRLEGQLLRLSNDWQRHIDARRPAGVELTIPNESIRAELERRLPKMKEMRDQLVQMFATAAAI